MSGADRRRNSSPQDSRVCKKRESWKIRREVYGCSWKKLLPESAESPFHTGLSGPGKGGDLASRLLYRGGRALMLQLMDLARENAALRRELERVREEAQALRLLVASEGISAARVVRSSAFGFTSFVRVPCQVESDGEADH